MENALTEFFAYPFDTDEAYQQGVAGMSAINDPDVSPFDVNEDILLRIKIFYFNRVTGKHITVEQVKNHDHGSSTVPELSSTSERFSEPGSRILTFAELQGLIESGKVDQIPNNKIIPDKLNESPPSESKAVPRKKPWELT